MEEARVAAAAADRIFPPEGESPSASDLGVLEYLDGQLSGPWGQGERLFRQEPFRVPPDEGHGWQSPMTPAEVYRHGLAAIDRLARDRHGAAFAELSGELQDEVLGGCEDGSLSGDFGPGFTAASFFALLRMNVTEGLFADPRYGGNRDGGGWRWLGFPDGVARYAHGRRRPAGGGHP